MLHLAYYVVSVIVKKHEKYRSFQHCILQHAVMELREETSSLKSERVKHDSRIHELEDSLIQKTEDVAHLEEEIKEVCSLTLSSLILHCHLHPLQAANCYRNSRLVVDEDDLMGVKKKRKLPCISKSVSWKFSF